MENNKNIEALESLIESKTWEALSNEEKAFVVKELGSKQEFLAMKEVDKKLALIKKSSAEPDPRILNLLRARMHRTQSIGFSELIKVRMPAYATAILLLFFTTIGWWFGGRSKVDSETLKITEVKFDTVYLASKPDTVFVNRIKYRYIQTPVYRKENTAVAISHEQERLPVGINMKEKEELDNLIVSGSDR